VQSGANLNIDIPLFHTQLQVNGFTSTFSMRLFDCICWDSPQSSAVPGNTAVLCERL